jgi:hypothetical protein
VGRTNGCGDASEMEGPATWPVVLRCRRAGGGRKPPQAVAAVGACETPISTHLTPSTGTAESHLVCRTSASSPLVAGVEVHASKYARSLPGADGSTPTRALFLTSGRAATEHVHRPAGTKICHPVLGYDRRPTARPTVPLSSPAPRERQYDIGNRCDY